MSFSTLGIGASALATAQRAVETAAHNVANSTVDGYTRQRLSITASPPSAGTVGQRGSGMVGTGVTVVSVDRLRSQLADLAYRGQASVADGAGARAEVLDRAQAILGPYAGGLSSSLDGLWSSFDTLALSPAGAAPRQLALDAATRVAQGVQDAAGQLDQIRGDALVQVDAAVTEVNTTAREVADMNRQIADAIVGGQAPNDLLDRRDRALDSLATLAGATVRTQPDGMVDVSIGGRVIVRGDRTTELVADREPPPAGGAGADVTLSVDGRSTVAGGSLGGRVVVLATDLRQVEARLGAFATDLRDRVNAQHAQGYDKSGAAGTAVFTGTGARDLAIAADLTPDRLAAAAGSAAEPYDGENALALARLRSSPLGDTLTELAASLGSRAAGAARGADAADAGLDSVTQQRSAADGVSVDEEMVDLVKYQHAYDAAARVISTADGMLDVLINRMGAGR